MSQEKTTTTEKQKNTPAEASSMPSSSHHSSNQQTPQQQQQRYPPFAIPLTTTQHSDVADSHSNQQRSNIPRLFHHAGRHEVSPNHTFSIAPSASSASSSSSSSSSQSSINNSTTTTSGNSTELSVHLKEVKVEKVGDCFKTKMSPIVSTNNPDALRTILQALNKRSSKAKKGVKKQEKMARSQTGQASPSPHASSSSFSASSSSSTMPLAPQHQYHSRSRHSYPPPSPTRSSSSQASPFSFFEPQHHLISPATSQSSSPSSNNASPYTSPAISPRISPRTTESHPFNLQPPPPPQYQHHHQLQYPQYLQQQQQQQQPLSPTLAQLNMQFQHLHTSTPNATSPRGSTEHAFMVHSGHFPLPNAQQVNPVYVGSASAESSPAPQEHYPSRFTPHLRSDSNTSSTSTASSSSGSNTSNTNSPRGSLSEEDRRRAEANRKRISISSLCSDDPET